MTAATTPPTPPTPWVTQEIESCLFAHGFTEDAPRRAVTTALMDKTVGITTMASVFAQVNC